MKKSLAVLLAVSWTGWWFTPDQQGQRYFRRDQFQEAATSFRDPMWSGTAWFRAGDFKQAAQQFSRRTSPEAFYNQGNAQLMLGKYEVAVDCYDQALEQRPDWPDAVENRRIAEARRKALETKGGNMTGGELGADEIVFDDKATSSDQTEEVAGGDELSNQEIQALWLRRVQTNPADFLKSKFAFQHAQQQEAE